MDLSEYQQKAQDTSRYGEAKKPESATDPMLALAHEAGSILDIYRKFRRDQLPLDSYKLVLCEELGDLLWYLAIVANAFDIDLGEIARTNLKRAGNRYQLGEWKTSIPRFDHGKELEEWERFPRRLTVGFSEETTPAGRTLARLTLVEAKPNHFPDGPKKVNGKSIGFTVGGPLGNALTDNSRRADGYRYHDAIHLGFMAVLGWSPVMRDLLQIKRRSVPATDETEDGARARFLEEGMAATLAKLALRRGGFVKEEGIGGEVLDIVQAVVVGLEVEQVPGRAWRPAISQGFKAMRQLADNGGGVLVADLDAHELTYSRNG